MNLTAIDLDDLFWLPDWTERAPDDFRARVDAATRNSGWVTAGNYSIARDILWARADTVIWLDYPFFTALGRLLKRSVRRLISAAPCCNGNTESLRKFLSRDSIVGWLFKSFAPNRKKYGEIFDNPAHWPHISFLRFRDPMETQRWLKDLS